MKTVRVNDLIFGEGKPKICASLMGQTLLEIKEDVRFLYESEADLAEWRVDRFDGFNEQQALIEGLKAIKGSLGRKPLLFTFRSDREGGFKSVSEAEYKAVYEAALSSGNVDLIDVEWMRGTSLVKEMIEKAHENNVKVIVSNHDFEKTPTKAELILRIDQMKAMGGDLVKIAVMPHTKEDVLTLMDAALWVNSQSPEIPLIAIAMAELGTISRLMGEWFGSAMSFGALTECSAPGQISVNQLSKILQEVHEGIKNEKFPVRR